LVLEAPANGGSDPIRFCEASVESGFSEKVINIRLNAKGEATGVSAIHVLGVLGIII
jgi:hypothetical protein